jgi:hypothetical protein
MRPRAWQAMFLAILPPVAGFSVDMRSRTVSSSRQVVVYCDEAALRSRAAGLAEDVKGDLLGLLGETDQWRVPVILAIETEPKSAASGVALNLVETPDGMSIQLSVRVGGDPASVHLEKHLLRALLLERMYRRREAVRAGDSYLEPPRWLVDAIIQMRRLRDSGLDLSQYRGLLQTEKLPPLKEILETQPDLLGSPAAEAVDAAYAYCLLRLLLDFPDGRVCLARLVEGWPEVGRWPADALVSHFPALGTSSGALQKWWTLGVARLAASLESVAMDAAGSEAAIIRMLQLEVVMNQAGEKTRYELEQFEQFLSLPGAKRALQVAQSGMMELCVRVHPLFRPVAAEYERVLASLASGKKRGLAEQLKAADSARMAVRKRLDAIADHLNHYEATQMGAPSGAFDGLLKRVPEPPPLSTP